MASAHRTAGRIRQAALREIARDGTTTMVWCAAVVVGLGVLVLVGLALQMPGPLGALAAALVLVGLAGAVAPAATAVARVLADAGVRHGAARRDALASAAGAGAVLGSAGRRSGGSLPEPVQIRYDALHSAAGALPVPSCRRFRDLGRSLAGSASALIIDGLEAGAATVQIVDGEPLLVPSDDEPGRLWQVQLTDRLAELDELTATVEVLGRADDAPPLRMRLRGFSELDAVPTR